MNQQVHFNVGDVVIILSHHWLGVIAGRDLHAKGPEVWINEMYKEFPHRLWQPHYVVLLDVGRVEQEAAYVGQVIIESRFMRSLWSK
jgi:hemimethylated DNA binding protein